VLAASSTRSLQRVFARHLLEAPGLEADEGHGGAVALIQRFGSAANLNIHLHGLLLDGLYRCGADGVPQFVEAGSPTDDEVHALLQAIITRLMKDAWTRVSQCDARLLGPQPVRLLDAEDRCVRIRACRPHSGHPRRVPSAASQRANRHSLVAVDDHCGVHRGFLPRGLSDTCPSAGAHRCLAACRCPTTLNNRVSSPMDALPSRCGVEGELSVCCLAGKTRRPGGVLRCTHLSTLRYSPLMSTTMTIRLEDEVKDRLDRLADSTNRSKSYLAAEAIREFVEANEWQIAEIRAALKEADAGDFASDKDVAALAKKWKVNAR
jgi:predicted transcriptional regulator